MSYISVSEGQSVSAVTERIVAMTVPTISIGLGDRGLRDRDFLSLSDPFVTIARPDTGGGFRVIRTSETKKVTFGKFSKTSLGNICYCLRTL